MEPVSFVHRICQDTADGVQHKNCRFVKRLTPITGIERANQKGLETVAEKVLAPHFRGEENAGKKVSHEEAACCCQLLSFDGVLFANRQ